ncbi:sulfotransferase domain-containing protein [Gynuella sp.]|uniref:sulfotransferase domain-containing protein n=1 Tax=Gynuella sp. TaxID=2969146 RepID=UPI003D0D68EC
MQSFFVLSTGRCGTQWLYNTLRNILESNFWITHEPIHLQYAPCHNSPANPLNQNKEVLEKHLNAIRNHTHNTGHYIECGFPSWRHLDWLYQQLATDVKIIYLHRDPTDTAISWLKQNAFVPPILPHIPEKELFHPACDGAKLSQYTFLWSNMSPFEKNLYYWAEVQLQAKEYNQQWPQENWLTIRFDELFNHCTINKILSFLLSDTMVQNIDYAAVDSFSGIPQSAFNRRLIYRHPDILAIARDLSYSYDIN